MITHTNCGHPVKLLLDDNFSLVGEMCLKNGMLAIGIVDIFPRTDRETFPPKFFCPQCKTPVAVGEIKVTCDYCAEEGRMEETYKSENFSGVMCKSCAAANNVTLRQKGTTTVAALFTTVKK